MKTAMDMRTLLREKKLSCFFISFFALALWVSAMATEFTIDASFSLLDKIGNDKKKRQFVIDFLGSKTLKKGTIIRKGKELAKGGYGIIYEGFCDDLNLIIKVVRSQEKLKGIQKELENSNAFINALAQKLSQDNLNYGYLLGAAAIIVPIIGVTADGSLIEEKIDGSNLEKITKNSIAPYDAPGGYPRDLQGAMERAACFFLGLVTLHDLGFVHCDIKQGNVMILNDALSGYPCRIIDLGGLKKFGESIGIHSSNGAPEYIEQTCMIFTSKAEQKEIREKLVKIKSQIHETLDPKEIERIKGQKHALEEQLKAIEDRIKLAQSTRCSGAYPCYDIYSSADILLSLMFGKRGLLLAKYKYLSTTKNPQDFKYLQMARDSNFKGEEYFRKKLFELNELMQKETAQAYPAEVLERLIKLQAKISAFHSHERPTAKEILEELQDMALADWKNGHYSIQ
jgi:serine/threonine protein kinase